MWTCLKGAGFALTVDNTICTSARLTAISGVVEALTVSVGLFFKHTVRWRSWQKNWRKRSNWESDHFLYNVAFYFVVLTGTPGTAVARQKIGVWARQLRTPLHQTLDIPILQYKHKTLVIWQRWWKHQNYVLNVIVFTMQLHVLHESVGWGKSCPLGYSFPA